MNIEVGQWYRCREEKVRAHVVGEIIGDASYRYIAAVYSHGEYSIVGSYSREGSYIPDSQSRLDLVEHIPNCTGPNWKPQKWRKATPEDAIAKKKCKVNGVTLTFHAMLSGVRFDFNDNVRFYICEGSGCCWYDSDCVEVLDD